MKPMIALIMLAGAGAACLAAFGPSEGPPGTVQQPKLALSTAMQSGRIDVLGDPLPPDALLRLGSTRLRHPGSATSAVYVGDLLASSGRDGFIRFWDRGTGKETRHFRGAEGPLYAIVYSPDPNVLAAVGPDGDVYLWDAVTGNEVQRFKGASGSPVQPAFSPDGSILAVGDQGGVHIWEVKSGTHLRMLDVPGYVLGLSFAANGRSLAASGSDQKVRIWETDNGKLLHQLIVDTKFPAENGRRSATFEGHFVDSLTFSKDSKFLLTSGPGGTRIWEAATGKKLNLLPELLRDRLGSLDHSTVSPNGRLLAVTSPNGVIGIWDWAEGREVLKMQACSGRVRSIAFSPDGKTLASLADGSIRQWDVGTGQPKGDKTGHQEPVVSVAYAPNGTTILTAGWDGTVRQWEARTAKEIRRWEVPRADNEKSPHSKGMREVVLSFDGKFIAAVRGDWVVVVWDATSAKEVYRFPGASAVAFSRDSKLMAYGEIAAQDGYLSGVIHILDIGPGKEVMSLRGHVTQISSLAFAPDGKTLISRGMVLAGMTGREPQETKYVRFWDLASRKETQIQLAKSNISGLTVSPDGRMLAATADETGEGRSIRLWETATGRLRGQLSVDGRYLCAAAFSPDGNTLASGDFSGRVWLWDVSSRKVLVQLQGHSGSVHSVAFAPDGKTLASGAMDTTVLVWDVSRFTKRGKSGELQPADMPHH
jgi:WD40 repeat protein